ncbi:hypothetical protein BOX15_Mlig026708g1 [Macrostomum lignano]|uniref:Uncharacterized protein n=1 Tax=Macrostomum lignano TaxID=282301 RepID=A0A267ESV8_9PLAT|nr:hypothetical protein BOX15_Mlig026708g1 [Macrostomum lignano]
MRDQLDFLSTCCSSDRSRFTGDDNSRIYHRLPEEACQDGGNKRKVKTKRRIKKLLKKPSLSKLSSWLLAISEVLQSVPEALLVTDPVYAFDRSRSAN